MLLNSKAVPARFPELNFISAGRMVTRLIQLDKIRVGSSLVMKAIRQDPDTGGEIGAQLLDCYAGNLPDQVVSELMEMSEGLEASGMSKVRPPTITELIEFGVEFPDLTALNLIVCPRPYYSPKKSFNWTVAESGQEVQMDHAFPYLGHNAGKPFVAMWCKDRVIPKNALILVIED